MKVYAVKDGRVYHDKAINSWFFIFEGTFLTSLANHAYSETNAAEYAHPQTAISKQEAKELIREGKQYFAAMAGQK